MYELICLLWATYGFAKNCHYKAKGSSFFGKHLLADRVVDNLDSIENYIDDLIEVSFLGNTIEAPSWKNIDTDAAEFMPVRTDNDDENFQNLFNLFTACLGKIKELNNSGTLTDGDANLINNIAQDFQQSRGLLWRQIL